MDTIQNKLLSHPLIPPIASGLLAHAVSHRFPPASLPAFAAVIALFPVLLTVLAPGAFWLRSLVVNEVVYLISLGLSITLYRLSPWHPLAKYPGPVLARISRFWAVRQAVTGQQHLTSHQLFKRYGNVVRTGPNHLIIREAGAIPVLHGTKDRWPRHARSQVHVPYDTEGSLIDIIDPAVHSKRRRIWERAFTPNAVKSYEPMLQARLAQLIKYFQSRNGQPIDIAEWFGFFSLDFMGDFGFGGSFDFMARGADTDGFHKFIVETSGTIDMFGMIPWIRPLLQRLPASKPKQFQKVALSVAEKRKNEGSQIRDLFHYLLNEDEADPHAPKPSAADLSVEASLALVAGSDTTGTALANVIYYLICYPEVFSRLRAELDAAAGQGAGYDEAIDSDRLAELKYLQAVINETLRLQPAVPNGITRSIPIQDGVLPVAGFVVPAATNVQIPTWSIHRDTRYFSPDPEAFWPERWLPEEGPKIAEARGQEFKLFQGAYMPFHYGPANCVGRSLALHEARTVLAVLIRRFDFAFAPGFQAQDWIDQLEDKFILIRGQLKVVMTVRK